MIWWTGLAPWDFEFPPSGGLISTFLGGDFELVLLGRLQKLIQQNLHIHNCCIFNILENIQNHFLNISEHCLQL